MFTSHLVPTRPPPLDLGKAEGPSLERQALGRMSGGPTEAEVEAAMKAVRD